MKKTIEKIKKFFAAKRQAYNEALTQTHSFLYDSCAIQYIAI